MVPSNMSYASQLHLALSRSTEEPKKKQRRLSEAGRQKAVSVECEVPSSAGTPPVTLVERVVLSAKQRLGESEIHWDEIPGSHFASQSGEDGEWHQMRSAA